ncbi:MAG: DUF255 domain-containing protein, partial [Acidobacteriaceae bacterium]
MPSRIIPTRVFCKTLLSIDTLIYFRFAGNNLPSNGEMAATPHLRLQTVLLCTALLAAPLSIPLVAQTSPANHLAGSHSAYLQHAAQQPVDWRPLGQSALDLAQKLDRPLLIDVGATWCSWCTLMDRDSYTHPEIARFINANFVAVKIDYDADPNLTRNLEHAAALENLPAGIPLTLFV